MNSFGQFFIDKLDTVADYAIKERFGETVTDKPDGATEFGNPATVTQPVHQSTFPSGEPRNHEFSFKPNATLIVAGVGVLLLLMVVFILLLRK